MRIRELFAVNLRRLRNERGLSQEDLADMADIHRTYVSLLERCRYAASIDMIEKLATALQVEPADLLKRLPQAGTSEKK